MITWYSRYYLVNRLVKAIKNNVFIYSQLVNTNIYKNFHYASHFLKVIISSIIKSCSWTGRSWCHCEQILGTCWMCPQRKRSATTKIFVDMSALVQLQRPVTNTILKRCLTTKQSQKAILSVIIILVFLKMGNISTIRIIEEQLTIHMLAPVGWFLVWIKHFTECA